MGETDWISRKDAIDTSLEFFVEFFGGAFDENAQKELIARFQRLSSTQPKRPKGEWILKEKLVPLPFDCSPLNYDKYDKDTHSEWQSLYFCSKCGWESGEFKAGDFCPKCGSYNGG